MEEIIIRHYEKKDRREVRRIFCDTADIGGPIDDIFGEREIASDIFVNYYTDFEPGSCWVVESEGRIAGYLTGCLNSYRYFRAMVFFIIPETFIRAIFRGAFWRVDCARLFLAVVKTRLRKGFSFYAPVKEYLAHMHIDIQEGFRGLRIGQRLMEKFIEQAKASGINGVHASVRQDNARAIRFFEKAGFTPQRKYLTILPHGNTFRPYYAIIYGRKI